MKPLLITALMLLWPLAAAALPAWEFTQPGDLGGWRPAGGARDVTVSDGVLRGRVTEGLMFLVNDQVPAFPATPYQWLELRIRASRRGEGSLMWAGDGPIEWGRRMPFQVPGGNRWSTVSIVPFWQVAGEIKKLRLDLYAGASFEIDWLRVRPWEHGTPGSTLSWGEAQIRWEGAPRPGPLPLGEGNGGGASDSLSLREREGVRGSSPASPWQSFPNHPCRFAAVSADLAERRVVSVTAGTTVSGQCAVVYSSAHFPNDFRVPFMVWADKLPHTYNIRLEAGRWGWRDPIVAIGLEIPPELQQAVHVRSVAVSDRPTGPPLLDVTYAGWQEAVNRAGRPCTVRAEVRNVGGEPAAGVKIALQPETTGLDVEPASRLVDLPPTGEKTVLTWQVMAPKAGEYRAKLTTSGPGRIPYRWVTLRFDPPVTVPKTDYVPTPRPVRPGTDILAYYFPGWDQYQKWDCLRRWAPERRPALGYYDESSPALVDWQIKMAVENGLTGFVVDWYWVDGRLQLNQWLDAYARARYRDLLKVCVMWCNHVGRHTPANMLEMTRCLLGYFAWPSYYRVDGKPVVVIWDSGRLRQELGGSEQVRATLDACSNLAKAAGYGGITFLECGLAMDNSADRLRRLRAEGYQGFTTYHETMAALCRTAASSAVPYEDIVDTAADTWRGRAAAGRAAGLTYYPVLESGWDSHPWHGENSGRQVIVGRTPALFERLLREAKTFAERQQPPFLVLGPLNEWGEGSYLEPCVEYGFGMYEAVRRVFGSGDPGQWPANIVPADVGLGPYEIPPPAPLTRWTPAAGLAGWQELMGMANLRVEGDALRCTTTTGDPALWLNRTVNLDQARSITIRLRFTGKLSPGDVAQLFWALPSGETLGAACLTVPLATDGASHDYTFTPQGNPYWHGTTQRLRLDPCITAGVEVAIEEVSCS